MATREAEDDSVKLERAAKLLHDEIGPLMSAAGLRLQLIKMDFPETAPLVQQVTEIMDEAIDRVRDMSRELRSPEIQHAKSSDSRQPKQTTRSSAPHEEPRQTKSSAARGKTRQAKSSAAQKN